MSNTLITQISWLEPLLPSSLPFTLLEKADQVLFESGKLSALLAPKTAQCLAKTLQLTNSYYSNLIEGQYTEPLQLSQTQSNKRPAKELNELAVYHMHTQSIMERFFTRHQQHITWQDCFSPQFIEKIHALLFKDACEQQRLLADNTLMVAGVLRDLAQKNVSVGQHDAPDFSAVRKMLIRMQQVYGHQQDKRLCLISALAYHHRLSWVHPFPDGNGRVIRLISHLQLFKLGLVSPLWSLSRGLARQQSLYYARLANADEPRRHDLDGRGQLSQQGLCEFIDFMLDTCLDQMRYIQQSLALPSLRTRLEKILTYEQAFIDARIDPEAAARALHILITQGEVTRNDFKIYLGMNDRSATTTLTQLIKLNVVKSPTPKSRLLYLNLPVWFAQLLFPDLHRRFI